MTAKNEQKSNESKLVMIVYHLSKALDHMDEAEELFSEDDYYSKHPENWDRIYNTVYNIYKHHLAELGAVRLEKYKSKEEDESDDELMKLLELI